MEPINVAEALQRDPKYQKGLEVFKEMSNKANAVSEEIATKLVESIVKKEDKFNITTAILSVAKTMTHLSSYLYDTEDEFLADVKKARASIVSDIIPALLNPQPCGKCEKCKNGRPFECENPQVRGEYTATRFLPIVCTMLVEYDLYSKVLHMYTTGAEEKTEDLSDVASVNKKEGKENGNE